MSRTSTDPPETPEEKRRRISAARAAAGSVRSEIKAAAVRANGALSMGAGGRPVKAPADIACTCGRETDPHLARCRISQTEAKRQSRARLKNSSELA